jgi:hypothetical protein
MNAASRTFIRVFTPGCLKFQLRKGEFGISVFDPGAVNPPLTETEILASFRPGSQSVSRTEAEIHAQGLTIVSIPGGPQLPPRLQIAHVEIQMSLGMKRDQFKAALMRLE